MTNWPKPHRLVGVIHLPPLPGSARGTTAGAFAQLLDLALRDAVAWTDGGADALIVENFGDVPFRKNRVEPHTIAAMTLAVDRIASETALPIGVNVLRNDLLSAVSIAAMTGGQFVRANIYVGAALTDQGLIEGEAAEVQALIRRLDAPIEIWADLDVKHAAQLAPRPITELAEDAVERGLASAVIVTGAGTGKPVRQDDLAAVKTALPATPVYAGSGVVTASIPVIFTHADGAIVGTSAKIDGDITQPVDIKRVRALRTAIDTFLSHRQPRSS